MKPLDDLKALLTLQVEADFADPDGRMAIADRAYLPFLERTAFYQEHGFDAGDIDTIRKLIDTMDVQTTVHVHFAGAEPLEPEVA